MVAQAGLNGPGVQETEGRDPDQPAELGSGSWDFEDDWMGPCCRDAGDNDRQP